MTEDKIRMAIHVAIAVNIDKLPQLKGKGRQRELREPGIKHFVDLVTQNLI